MLKFIKTLIAILAFGFLFSKVPYLGLIKILKNTTLELSVFFIAISFVLIYVSTLKWKLFIGLEKKNVSFFLLYKLYIIGYFINLFIPSFVGGDAVRSYKLKNVVGLKPASIATFLERYTGFITMLAMALVFVSFNKVISDKIYYFILILNLSAFIASYFLFSNFIKIESISFLQNKKFTKKIISIKTALAKAIKNKRELLISILLSLIFHLLTVINTLIAAHMLGWYSASFFDLLLVLPIILTISAIPLTPNGLGVQEGAFFVFLQAIGSSSEVALGIALLLRAKSYLLALVGGAIYIRLKP